MERRIAILFHNRDLPGADAIQVEARGGAVVLRGSLPSPRAKALCLQCCQHVAGVLRVRDELESPDE